MKSRSNPNNTIHQEVLFHLHSPPPPGSQGAGDEKSRCATSIRNEEETEPTQINPGGIPKSRLLPTPQMQGGELNRLRGKIMSFSLFSGYDLLKMDGSNAENGDKMWMIIWIDQYHLT